MSYQPQLKIPDPGKGRLKEVDKSKTRDPSKAPDFRGLVNCDGHVMWLSIWYNPAKQGQHGMMPPGWSCALQTYDPNSRQQQPQQPQYAQQQHNYAPGPQPPQHGAPQGGYQPQPPQNQQPPQNGGWQAGAPVHPQPPPQQGGGYTPAPGYTPPQQPRPTWGGQTNGGQGQAQGQQQPMGDVINDKLPFAPEFR